MIPRLFDLELSVDKYWLNNILVICSTQWYVNWLQVTGLIIPYIYIWPILQYSKIKKSIWGEINIVDIYMYIRQFFFAVWKFAVSWILINCFGSVTLLIATFNGYIKIPHLFDCSICCTCIYDTFSVH